MAIQMASPIPAGIGSIQQQDQALEAVYRRDAARLRGRLLISTRDPAVAEDLVSEAFLRLAAQMRAGCTPDDPSGWLYRVGMNLLVSRARHAKVATRAMPGLFDHGVGSSPEDEVVCRERDQLLLDVLQTLDGDDRHIVVLAARGYRPQEIAAMIGRSGPATRTRLCRARGRLRARLESAGLTA